MYEQNIYELTSNGASLRVMVNVSVVEKKNCRKKNAKSGRNEKV